MRKLKSEKQYYRVLILAMGLSAYPVAWMYSLGWGITWTCALALIIFVILEVEKHGE